VAKRGTWAAGPEEESETRCGRESAGFSDFSGRLCYIVLKSASFLKTPEFWGKVAWSSNILCVLYRMDEFPDFGEGKRRRRDC
jgi:hypothetical protein